jgi:hypothetical protein
MVGILTLVDITFFTQNKSMNNHLTFGGCFMGHLYGKNKKYRSSNKKVLGLKQG